MGNENYRVWEYEWMVWKKAILDTVAFYKTVKLAWIGNIIGIVLTLSGFLVWGGAGAMNGQLLYLEAGLLGFIGVGIFYILVHRMSSPLILYRKQESLANKFTWNDVSIKIDKMSIPDAVCLEVSNYKSYDIQKCSGVIIYLEKSGVVVLPDDPQGPKRCLAWHKENGDTFIEKKLSRKGQPGSTRLMIITRHNRSEKTAWLATKDLSSQSATPGNISLEPGVVYKIRISWSGEVDGRRLDEYTRDYWITFRNAELEIKEVK